MSRCRELFPARTNLEAVLGRFPRARVAVVGDFFLDRYLIIDPDLSEPSVETGIPTRQVVAIRNSPGAAGTVVNNLVALGAGELMAVGIIGRDAYGHELTNQLERRGVDTSGLFAAPDRFTPTYTKPMLREAGGERELERIDIINRAPTPAEWEDAVLQFISDRAPSLDGVIILDQVNAADQGVVTQRVREGLATLARRHADKVFYADSRQRIGAFRGVLIKANHHEALRAVGSPDQEAPDPESLFAVGKELMKRVGRPVLITMGPRGMLVTEPEGQQIVPGFPMAGPIDIVGAGDSATAGTVLSLCAGASLPQAALVGNLVASLTVQQIGTTGTASPPGVLGRYDEVADRE